MMMRRRLSALVVALVAIAVAFSAQSAVSTARATEGDDAARFARTAGVPKGDVQKVLAKKAAPCKLGVHKTYAGGPGHSQKVYAGVWKCESGRGFCVDFPRHNPFENGGVSVVSKSPGATAANSKLIMTIGYLYGGTGDNTTAARAALAVWQLTGGTNWVTWRDRVLRKKYKADWAGANAVIQRAKYYVTAKGSISAPMAHVGSGWKSGAAKLMSGKTAIGGRPVKISASSNASLSSVARVTGSNGVAGFKIARTNLGRVNLSAIFTLPHTGKAKLTIASGYTQRVLIAPYTRAIKATYGYDVAPSKASIVSKCDTDCDGQATLTVSVCATGSGPKRVFVVKNGTAATQYDVAAGKCVSKSIRGADNDLFTFNACYLTKVGGTCSTKQFGIGTHRIVCPPWAEAYVKVRCDCGATTANKVAYQAPSSAIRGYRGLLKLPDGTVKQYDLTNGQLQEFALPAGTRGKVAVGFIAYDTKSRDKALKTVWFPGTVTVN